MPEVTSPPAFQARIREIAEEHKSGWQSWNTRRHLLDTKDLQLHELDCLLKLCGYFKGCNEKRLPPFTVLHGKTVGNLFYESSTRTRSSFQIAARKLGADVVNLDIASSSVAKGETISDTALQLVSMDIDAIVQRHSSSGSAHLIADEFGDKLHVINAGDGWNAHPTQALLDYFTMVETRGSLKGAKVAIVGDIMHSRVARSNIWLLQKLGVDIHVTGPPTLLPEGLASLGVTVHTTLIPAIENADFVMALRMQMERQEQGLIPGIGEYKKLYRIDRQNLKLANKNVKIMHPGPVNRGIELSDDLVDDPAISLIRNQATNGVAVRMAVLCLLMKRAEDLE